MSVLYGLPSPTFLLTRGILQHQNEIRYKNDRNTLLPPTIYFVVAFINAKMELKIYHVILHIMTDICFFLAYIFFYFICLSL